MKTWTVWNYSYFKYHTKYYRCSYVVNSVHESFAETVSHCKSHNTKQVLKHENFTVSYHSHSTLLPQNILQLQEHLTCTPCNINNLRFTKIRVRWNGGLPLHVPNFKLFLTLLKFEWVCSIWPKFDSGCCNLPRWFQMYPSLNEVVSITEIWLRLLEFAQMFLIVWKFKWSTCILPKSEWSRLKFNKTD